MNPLRNLVKRLVAWNRKPRYRSAGEVVQLLQTVATNTAHPAKLDGFIYIPIIDPKLEQIRDEFGALYGPGFEPTDTAFVRLLRRAEALAK